MRHVAIALTFALSACATAAPPTPITQPRAAFRPEPPALEGDVVALALSGGGARAAAFSLGVLQGLRDMHSPDGAPLTDRVKLVTGVSGGAIAAAYFGQHGAAGLDTFRAAYLDKDWASSLNTSPASPLNWARAWRGGLNGPDHLANWLDREVFAGGRMSTLWSGEGAQVWLNATDLGNGVTFAFAPAYFDALCADLGNVRIADAVAASMAVPVVFQPILAEPHLDACRPQPEWATRALTERTAPALVRRTAQAFASYRDPAQVRYLHLVDGGTLDNLGLTSLSLARLTSGTPYGPLTERDAVRVRRLTFLVVNAEKLRDPNWQRDVRGPSGAEAFDAYLDMTIEVENREAYDYFARLMIDWQTSVRNWRCGLSADEVFRFRGSLEGWHCNDIAFAIDMISFRDLEEPQRARLGAAETRVTLSRDLTDDLIVGGRTAVTQNAVAQALTRPLD